MPITPSLIPPRHARQVTSSLRVVMKQLRHQRNTATATATNLTSQDSQQSEGYGTVGRLYLPDKDEISSQAGSKMDKENDKDKPLAGYVSSYFNHQASCLCISFVFFPPSSIPSLLALY